MSHYTVGVIIPKHICEDIDEEYMFDHVNEYLGDILDPFDENTEVAPYISSTRAELIEEARKEHARALTSSESYFDKLRAAETEQELYEAILDWHGINDDNRTQKVDADGNMLSTYNPNSKWDWWVVNGRWTDEGIPDTGIQISELLARPHDEAEYARAYRFYELYVDGKPCETDEDHKLIEHGWYRPEYLKERYGSADAYATELTTFSTFAVITPDGEWHEPGPMGWFGCSGANINDEKDWYAHYKERYLEPYKDDIFVLVDCHI